jgi:3beta-hydroxy-delta5-steroid dehydrogenase/steroid delta-isomerase
MTIASSPTREANAMTFEIREPRPTTELGTCLVTGGTGYLGRHLAAELARRGIRTRIFDRLAPAGVPASIDVVQGDLRSDQDVRKACEGVDTVFHTAAVMHFGRFPGRRERDESYAVNVQGVERVVRACLEAGVRRLVHTSSNNVTFGAPVIDGDETWPYATEVRDLYTRTKILGEQIALAADAHAGLSSCAIRLGGIYGPGGGLMLRRLVEECAAGRFVARIGGSESLSDNTYVDNAVDGEIEAARHLLPGSPLCGQAYFVTDGAPINYWEFFRPIVTALGFRFPERRIPASLMLGVAWVWEWLHRAVRFPPPLLTHLEVRKVVLSHYSRIDRAHRDFGWVPPVTPGEALAESIDYCREILEQIRENRGRDAVPGRPVARSARLR